MEDVPPGADRFDSIGDFYGERVSESTDPLQDSLQRWDHNQYLPLQSRDPELYRLICNQVGFEIEILLGDGSVRLGTGPRKIELTWNGDDEDLLDLVLEGARLLAD